MNRLKNVEEKIYRCSKCGLCQSVCPSYQNSGNDCDTARGIFIMLYGVLRGRLEPNENILKYIEKCLSCRKANACKAFCPSGIDMQEIFLAAKQDFQEFFEKN